MKNITVLGSTGSIGRQSIEVAVRNSIKVEALSANQNVDLLEEQARSLCVKYVAMADDECAKELKRRLSDTKIKVFSGNSGIKKMIEESESDTCINSIVGRAGLLTSIWTIENKKNLALANKESLVCAGKTVKELAKKNNVCIIPVDSEHSAIWQCLSAGRKEDVSRLILTASGGPFFGKKRSELEKVTPSMALSHPTWRMGSKITIDSATMMNKGFEIIEAVHLFDLEPEKVDVLVHRESVVHSMVEYKDGAVIAEMGIPDMRTCISLALSYPERFEKCSNPLDLAKVGNLSFYEPDDETFFLMDLARFAIKEGGILPAVMNASDEAAVRLFLDGKIKFTDIGDIIYNETHNYINTEPSLEDIVRISDEAEAKIIKKYS